MTVRTDAELKRRPPLPNAGELAKARDIVQDAVEAVGDIRWRVRRVAELAEIETAGEPLPAIEAAPTFEDIGRLYVWTQDVREGVEELMGYLDSLDRENEKRAFPYLVDLDSVRASCELGEVEIVPAEL